MVLGRRVVSGSKVSRRALVAVVAAGALVLAGCSGDPAPGGGGSAGTPGAEKSETPPVAKVTVEPADGTKDLNPRTPIKVAVTEGTLEQVALTNPEGKQVAGKLAEDKKSWASTDVLGYGKTYTLGGSATGTDGKAVPLKGSYTVVNPAKTMRATINPVDNATVGIAMPVKIEFDEKIQDKAAAEKALKVTTSAPVEGSWAWVNDREVHYRPKEFWPANIKVTVKADFLGVPYSPTVFGKSDLSTSFNIGRAQVVKADVRTHRMIVEKDGKQLFNFPASLGKEDQPDLRTRNGIYVVNEKHEVEKMDNPKYGYTNVMKKWAVRIANSGEFIHENDDNRANIGKNNTSHGCINLLGTDAKQYFDSAIVGDPVIISGSAGEADAKSDIFDWRINWQQWVAKSAVK